MSTEQDGPRILAPTGAGIPVSTFVIATPGNPQPEMLRSLIQLVKPPGTIYVEGDKMQPGRAKLNMAEARNELVRDFLEAHKRWPGQVPEPLRWLFMVDGDAVLHPMTLHRLQSWNQPVVGALCVMRYLPFGPMVYRGLASEDGPMMRSYYVQYDEVMEWCLRYPEIVDPQGPALLDPAPEDSLHPMDWTATHCYLAHRSVFEAVPEPWFEMAPSIRWGSGSDRIFFEKVQAAGIQLYVDFSVVAGHVARRVLGLADYVAWSKISIREDELDGGAVFCGDDGAEREPEPGADTEPASNGVRAARTLAGADPGGLAEAAGWLIGDEQ